MIRYLEDNDGFTLDELLDSIISEKIFNINENEILTRLATAIKRKFTTIYNNTSSNIFVRASLADSTYKSQTNILFSTHTSRNVATSLKPRVPQKPTILNWFKRDVSKNVEKKEAKQECVYTEEQPYPSIVPVDIDPFGTLVITGSMLAFSSDDESTFDSDTTHIKCLTTSSTENAGFGVDEDDETCADYNSLNNCSTGDGSDSSKSIDFDLSDSVMDGNTGSNEMNFSYNVVAPSCESMDLDQKNDSSILNNIDVQANEVGIHSAVDSSNAEKGIEQTANRDLVNDVKLTEKPVKNVPLSSEKVTEVKLSNEVEVKAGENVFCLGNNVIIFHGSGNNTTGCYWLLSKVFECELKSLITPSYQENEFITFQNKKVQHIDCTLLLNYLNNELITIDKLKEILLNRNSQICVLDHFDHLLKNWQMLMNKWFSKVYEKVFVILCNNLNCLDFRIKSYSLVLRLNGLKKDKFIDYTHKLFLRSYNMPNKNYMNTRNYVMNANKNRYCLSRLNMIEIANRVDFDIILFFNTLVDAQRNYINAIRKHKTKQSHKWLRNLTHVILHNSNHFVKLKSSVMYAIITNNGSNSDTIANIGDVGYYMTASISNSTSNLTMSPSNTPTNTTAVGTKNGTNTFDSNTNVTSSPTSNTDTIATTVVDNSNTAVTSPTNSNSTTVTNVNHNTTTNSGTNVDKPVTSQTDISTNKQMNDVNKLINKLITDIVVEYGVHELDLMLIDFYNRLMEMGSIELESLKGPINQLISNMFLDKPLADDLTDLEVKINCMKFLVNDIVLLIHNLRFNRTT